MSQNLKEIRLDKECKFPDRTTLSLVEEQINERIKELSAEGTIRGIPIAFREIKELNRLLGKE